MSVVRKYQAGGNVPNQYDDYPQFLASELEKLNFKTKAGRYSGQIPLWEKFVTSGEALKSFSSDPVTKGYSIKGENLSPEYALLAGSDKPVKTNLFGQLVVDNAEDMNSVLADITKRYIATKQTIPTNTTQSQKASLGNLEDYMKEKVFGKSEDWENLWEARKKTLGTKEAIQAELGKHAKDYLSWYKGKLSAPESGVEYTPLEREQDLLKSIETGWESFIPEANRLGWDIARLANYEPEKSPEQGINTREDLKKQLISKGFGITDAEAIASGNEYTSVLPELGITDAPWLNEALKNYSILYNPENKRTLVVNPLTGQPVEDILFKDPDAPGYGTYFSQSGGVPTLFRPGVEGYRKELFADPAKQFGAARPLVGTLDGEEVELIGHPEKVNGKTLYYNTIIAKDPNTGQYIELHRTPEGKYINPVTKQEHAVDIKEYGNFDETTYPAYYKYTRADYKDPFSSLAPIAPTRSISEIAAESLPLKYKNDPAYAKTLAELKYLISNGNTLLDKWEAARIYRDKLAVLENNQPSIEGILRASKPSKGFNLFSNLESALNKYKNGGVLKLQKGNKFSIGATSVEDLKKIKDLRGTVTDMSTLDKASLASSAVSIIPGLGAIGAGTTTVLDALSDIEKTGKVDYGKLALNLGFTGLSLIGLGGVGAATKAARTAQVASKLSKAAQAAEEVAKLRKVAKTTSGVIKPTSTAVVEEFKLLKSGLSKLQVAKTGTLKDAGLNVAELKILKGSNILNKNVSLTTAIGKGTVSKATETLSKLKTPVFLDTKAAKVLKTPLQPNTAVKIPFSEMINPKVASIARKTAVGAMAAPTALSVGSIASDIKEGGFENIQQSDLKNVILASGAFTNFLKNKSLAKDINKLIKKTPQNSSFKIGDKTFTTKSPDELVLPKEAKPILGKFRKKATNTKNEKILEDFKKTFKEQTGQDLPEGTKLSDIETILGTVKTNGLAKPNTMTTAKYKRAMEKVGNFKSGGILKMQKAGKFPTPIYDKGYFDYVQGLDQDWFDKNKQALLQVNPNIKSLNQLKYLGTDFKYGPVHKYLESSYNPQTVMPQENIEKEGQLKIEPWMTNSKLFTGSKTTPIKDIKDIKGSGIKTGWKLSKDGLLMDPYNLLNTAAFMAANRATNKAIRSQVMGVMQVPQLPLIGRQYFRTATPFRPIAEVQVGNINSTAGRIANSMSDIDKSIAVKLSGMAQGNELRSKAILSDQEALEKVKATQMQSDRQTDLANLDIITKNKLAATDAAQKVFQLKAAKTIGLNQNLQNYLASIGRTLERKEQEDKSKKYFDLVTGQEPYEYSKSLETLQKQAAKAKDLWLKKRASLGPVKLGEETWEETEGKPFILQAEDLNKKWSEYQRKLSGANLAMQLPNLKFAKGGSLEEKKELIRYRAELSRREKDQSRKEREQRDFYKIILKNNEMMLKSLSRIFK